MSRMLGGLLHAVAGVCGGLSPSTPTEIAQELVSPTKQTHWLLIGDSRTTAKQRQYMQANTSVVWDGTPEISANAADTTGHDTDATSGYSGDTAPTSPFIGGEPTWFPGVAFECEFSGGTEPGAGSNATLSRMSYAGGPSEANYPLLWNTLEDGQSAKLRCLYYKHAGGTTTQGVRLHARFGGSNFGDAGNYDSGAASIDSTGSGYGELSVNIPDSHDWSTYDTLNADVVAEPSTATETDAIFAYMPPFLQGDGNGAILHSYSVGGRSIDGILSRMPAALFTDFFPLLGDNRGMWVDIGTNNPAGNDKAAHKTKVQALIDRFRAGSPNAPVILTSSYPASTDSGEPYYVTAHRELADENDGVLFLDTYNAAPSYADANALGLMSDTVHYTDNGVSVWAARMSDLIHEAAEEWHPTDETSLRQYVDETGFTLNGGAASAWMDQSSYSADYAQGTAAAQPTVVGNWRNGRSAIQGGSGDHMLSSYTAVSQACTIYMAGEWKQDASQTYQNLWDGAGAGRTLVRRYGAGGSIGVYAGDTEFFAPDFADGAPYIMRLVLDGASSSIKFWTDGSLSSQGTGSPGSNAPDGEYLGAGSGGVANYNLGKTASRAMFSGAHDGDELDTEMLAYLRKRLQIAAP